MANRVTNRDSCILAVYPLVLPTHSKQLLLTEMEGWRCIFAEMSCNVSRNCIVGSDRVDRTGRKENCQGCVLCYIFNMTFYEFIEWLSLPTFVFV